MLKLTLFSFYCIWASSSVASAEAIHGTLFRTGTQALVRLIGEPSSSRYYRLLPQTNEAAVVLARLETGDTLVGNADIDPQKMTISLETVDFVGLRKIIGFWNTATKGVMNFRSYSEVSTYALPWASTSSSVISTQKQFKYTVTPAAGSDWVMFLSDNRETQMAFLDLKETEATIRILDSKTGDVSSVLRLQKISH